MTSRWLASAAALLFGVGGIASQTGTALAKCDPHRTPPNFLVSKAGWEHDAGARVGGVSGSEFNYSPWVYNSSTYNYSLGVVELADGPDEANTAYLGWIEYAGGTRETYWQWTVNGTLYNAEGTAFPTGDFTTYQIDYGNPVGDFGFYVNGSLVDSETSAWAPQSAMMEGRIFNWSSQMPGDTSTAEQWKTGRIYLNGSWQSFDGQTINSNNSIYASQNNSNSWQIIWDRAC